MERSVMARQLLGDRAYADGTKKEIAVERK